MLVFILVTRFTILSDIAVKVALAFVAVVVAAVVVVFITTTIINYPK